MHLSLSVSLRDLPTGSVDLVRAFAEDFEGIAELAAVSVQGAGEAGQVELTVRSSSGAVTHPTVTFSQTNQRYTRAQWREQYDEGIFSGRTCPMWVDDDSVVVAEVAVEGAMSRVEFRSGIAEMIESQQSGGSEAERLVTVTSFSQTLTSAMILPGVASDFVADDTESAGVVASAAAREAILREGIAESINCCVVNASVAEDEVIITGVTSATAGRRRQLQSAQRVRVGYQLVTETEGIVEWSAGQFYPLRLANSINDADTSGSIEELGVLNFAAETPAVTTSVEYSLDTSELTPTARSALALDLGTESAVLSALNSQLPASRQVGGVAFVSLQAAAGTDPQCATYLYSSMTGPDFPPTLIENGAITGHELVLGDESLSEPIDLVANGLRFDYFHRAVRWIVVSSNGFVYLRGDDTRYEALRQLSTGRGAGERLPAPSYGAVIAPYWEDYDPSGVHCGNTAGRVHWKVMTATAEPGSSSSSSATMVVEFDRVKSCGGGSSGTKNIASWQLVLKSEDDSFDVVMTHARGDSGIHTIGFQDWDGKEGQMMCHGEGDTKCFKQSTTYRVNSVRPSYSCHADGVCATAALAAQGGGSASGPRYAACECPACFSGDGLSSCNPSPCGDQAAAPAAAAVPSTLGGDITLLQLVVAVVVALLVGVGANTACHRWRMCPMYRPKAVAPIAVAQQQHQQPIVLGTIVDGSLPPLQQETGGVASSFLGPGPPDDAAYDAALRRGMDASGGGGGGGGGGGDGVGSGGGVRFGAEAGGGFNPLVTIARVVQDDREDEMEADKAKQQQATGPWLAGGGGGGGGGARPREP
eukprot:COSAG06_NODE_1502_length_9255_cov_10.094826_6_plen_817_part_00